MKFARNNHTYVRVSVTVVKTMGFGNISACFVLQNLKIWSLSNFYTINKVVQGWLQ